MNDNLEPQLEKKLKPINVWALALGSIIGWGAFVMPGTTFLPKAGTLGTAIGLLCASLVMITIALNYGYMVQKYPVAGGEYAFAKNTFGRRHAFFCGWFLGLSYLCIVPLNATALGLVSRKLLGGVLEVGYLYTIAGWDIYAGEIILASAVLILFAWLSIKGISVAGWIQTVMAFSLVASVFILAIAAVLNSDASISNMKPYYPKDQSLVASIASVVAIAPWAFVGFDSIPQAAEEFAFSPKKTSRLMIFAILFGGLVYILLNLITASVMPWEILLSKNYDWPTGEAVEIIMGKVGLFFLGIALVCAVLSGVIGFYMATSRLLLSMAREKALPNWFSKIDSKYKTPINAILVCAVLSGVIGFYMATSRLLLSMAREKALPNWFSKIDSKYKTPINAILFVMIISLIAPWFGRKVLSWVVDMSSIGAAIGYGYTCIASYKTLKNNPQDKKPVLKVLSVIGFTFSIIFVLLLIIPGMPSYLAVESRVCLVVWMVIGLIFYFWSKKYR